MTTVQEIIRRLEVHFPTYLAEDWDNPGLQIGNPGAAVQKVLTALDINEEVVQQALEMQAQLIVTHHPLFFKPVRSLRADRQPDREILRLIQAGISVYSAHTNLDTGENGLNQYLSEKIGLENIRPLNRQYTEPAVKVEVMVPSAYAETVRAALAQAGAGAVGNYSDSFFMTGGTSTFLPQEGTHPFKGQTGKLERSEEVKLETVCWEKSLSRVLQVLDQVHPYEEPAFSILPLKNAYKTYSLGRVGDVEPTTLVEWATQVKQTLGLGHILVTGDRNTVIRKVAVVSGAGIEFMKDAVKKGCQVLLTGDMKYHEAQAAHNLGLCVVDAGHQGTEQIVTRLLKDLLDTEKVKNGWKIAVEEVKIPPLIYSC